MDQEQLTKTLIVKDDFNIATEIRQNLARRYYL